MDFVKPSLRGLQPSSIEHLCASSRNLTFQAVVAIMGSISRIITSVQSTQKNTFHRQSAQCCRDHFMRLSSSFKLDLWLLQLRLRLLISYGFLLLFKYRRALISYPRLF